MKEKNQTLTQTECALTLQEYKNRIALVMLGYTKIVYCIHLYSLRYQRLSMRMLQFPSPSVDITAHLLAADFTFSQI